MQTDYEVLKPFCQTDIQRQTLQACIDCGSNRKAAKKLNKAPATVHEVINSLKKKAARHGVAPEFDMVHQAAPGFSVKGTTTLYHEEKGKLMQWVKTNRDLEDIEAAMREVSAAFKEDLPRYEPTERKKKKTNENLLNCFVLTDYHLGMLAWSEETGDDDWDLHIAEELLIRWFETAVNISPDADTAVFAQLGDFLHWDGFEAVTPTSGNVLDADTRRQMLIRTAIKVTRHIVQLLLDHYEKVVIVWADGNHDPDSSAWMKEWVSIVYQDEPRVFVDTNPDSYYCYEFGLVSLFFHHGHKRKVANVDDVFVAKFREVFGRTKFSYAHMGHFHNTQVRETNLMVVEQHRTLAAPDAYAAKGGWMSGREAKVLTYHKDFGMVGSVVITPEMCK